MVKKLRINEANSKNNFKDQLYDVVEDIIYAAEGNLAQQVASKVDGYDVLWDANVDGQALIKARDAFIKELVNNLLAEFDE